MSAGRQRAESRVRRSVVILSFVVGAICFVLSFYILAWIGLAAGIIKFPWFEPPGYSKSWTETLWWVLVWGRKRGTQERNYRSVASHRSRVYLTAARFRPIK